jgi:hypothetical protein
MRCNTGGTTETDIMLITFCINISFLVPERMTLFSKGRTKQLPEKMTTHYKTVVIISAIKMQLNRMITLLH